ncbi:trigger factor [Clostridium formicaceticum]|uniref:Trigger factor n=1 Tax=Clostridium formicaceticum TaxID=1497 RepID=A0AAC9RL56_9CLOT|nr:trigger factor [Clostridium formicaceticum]AOY75937.1 trigger factor [Clostridium formicaceticum]ARE86285.1 Trigger factor [Clostridium formicaceticum]
MSSEIIKREDNKVTLKVAVGAEKFEEGINKAYNKMRSRFNIPGFRKGKAPRRIIELNYGAEVFYEEAINITFPEAYDEAIEEHKIHPVDRPSIDDIEEIEKGKDVVLTVSVEVMPEVVVENYKGIEVEKKEYNVQEEDLEKEIDALVEKNARMVTVENRPVKEGDMVIIDYKGMMDGVAFEGGTAEKQNLTIGSGQFIQGFEEQLIGANIGDEVEVKVTFPEEYHSKELAGKDAVFEVKIHEIKEKELPKVDDEFAKDVSEFDTLEELKADTKKKLEEQAKNRTEQELRNSVVEAVVEKVEINLPGAVVVRQVASMLRDFEYSLSYQGLDLEYYYNITGTTEEDLKNQMKADAEKRVKTQVVLDKISQLEGIEATEDEVNQEIEKMAEQYKQEVDKVKERLREEDIASIKDNIVVRKTIDFLVENAKVA